MRIIDADAPKEELMYIDGIPAVTERDIDNAPTIDAIHVDILIYADSIREAHDKVLGVPEEE